MLSFLIFHLLNWLMHQQMQLLLHVVGRDLAPDCHEHVFAVVKQLLLIGCPAKGGFGALAWREHLLARHAWRGALFVSAPLDTDNP